MDSTQPRPSGLPRPSKLPVIRSRPSQSFLPTPQPSALPQAPKSTTAAAPPPGRVIQKRKSTASLSRPAAIPTSSKMPSLLSRPSVPGNSSKYGAVKPPGSTVRPASRGATQRTVRSRPSGVGLNGNGERGDNVSSHDSFRSASRQEISDDQTSTGQDAMEPPSTPAARKSRPSLSDRTMDSIKKLPATPKDRRRSSFFAPVDSPMPPPPRPTSSLSRNGRPQSRPGTSDGNSTRSTSRPVTPGRTTASAKPTSRTSLGGFGFGATPKSADKRRVSTGLTARLQSSKDPVPASPNAPPVPKSTVIPNGRSTVKAPSKTTARPVKPRPPFDSGNGQITETAKPSTENALSQSTTSRAGTGSSSSALREQIAAARAAARKEKARHDSGLSSTAAREQSFGSDVHQDPFNQGPKDDKHILRNRIKNALMEGKLNISAMGLKVLPEEVLKMYNSNQIEESKVNWAEVVDLTKLIAADNDIAELSDDIFPDRSHAELAEDEDAPDNVFGALELLDLHGNSLQTIPMGFRRLEMLTTLNLTHNKLENSALPVIAEIKSLKELRLGHNALTGNLPSEICQLTRLERLEIQDNRLLGLPEVLRELASLKVLNVANNQLTALPMEAMQHLPLVELDANGNALLASLFPMGVVSAHPTLQTLNVANNSLAALTFSESMDMPKLRSLDVTNNHLTGLPPVSEWTELITLAAGGNKMIELPIGFTSLKKLKNANFTSNDLRILDPEIARMTALESLILASNPLREKKFLTMSADRIKADLRERLEPSTEAGDTDQEHHTTDRDSFVSAPEHRTPLLTVQPNGTLDLAQKNLTDDINDDLGTVLEISPVKTLHLQNNNLTLLPSTLSLAQHLHTLNLANNPLTAADYIPLPFDLPALQNLTLTSTRLTSLQPLVENLCAPRLTFLDISINKLQGTLPALRIFFPSLTTLLANDNRFSVVTPTALRGMHVVNLSGNELKVLEPGIGLLGQEGLRELVVGGNLFRVPGWKVLEKGTGVVLEWLRGRIEGEGGFGGFGRVVEEVEGDGLGGEETF